MNSEIGRPLNNWKFLNYKHEKEQKFFKFYDSFVPDGRKIRLVGKFYSRHDEHDFTPARPEFIEMIRKYKVALPREKYSEPITESHNYGWHDKPLIVQDKINNTCYCKLKNCTQ